MEDISWECPIVLLLCHFLLITHNRNRTARYVSFRNTRTEHKNKGLVVAGFLGFFMIFERRTNLGLGYRGAFSITQRREGQAKFQLSITLTKIEKQKGREDILKGIPHSSENNFLKVIWFHRPGLPGCSNTAVQAALWKSLWREASLASYFERLQHLLHFLLLFCSSRGPRSENRKRCTATCFWT